MGYISAEAGCVDFDSMTAVGTRQMVPTAFVDQQTGVMYVDQSEFPFSFVLPFIGRPIDNFLWGSFGAVKTVANRVPKGSFVGSFGSRAATAAASHGAKRAISDADMVEKNAQIVKKTVQEGIEENKKEKAARRENSLRDINNKIQEIEEQRQKEEKTQKEQNGGEDTTKQDSDTEQHSTDDNEHTSGPLTAKQFEQKQQREAEEYQNEAEAQNKQKEEEEAKKLQEEKLTRTYWKKEFFKVTKTRELNEQTRAASEAKLKEMDEYVNKNIEREQRKHEESKITCTVCMKCASQYT